jgi:membrane associated rhomboid family serine protease
MIPYGDQDRVPAFPVMVYLLALVNVAVFALEFSLPETEANALINAFAVIPYNITHNVLIEPPSPDPPYLTLITSMFLHGGFPHIFFNLLFLFVFGPHIEYVCGSLRFLVFYLLCGVAGGLVQVWLYPGSHVPTIGASGAIAGVLGAFLVKFPRNEINTVLPIGCFPVFLSLPAYLVIILWFIPQLLHGFGALRPSLADDQGDGIAYVAHIGGFVTGMLTIGLFSLREAGPPRYRYYRR